MRVTLSPLISDARGKLGNLVFSVARSGQHYVRDMAAIASNPRSDRQQAYRGFIVWLAHEWRVTLDAAAKALWEEFAQSTMRFRVDADQGGGKFNLIPRGTGFTSGWNAYIGVNCRLFGCNNEYVGYINTPPTGPAPYPVESLTMVWDGPGEFIDISWDEGDLSADFTIPALRIWIQSYEGGCHKQLVTCSGTTGESDTVADVRYALGILGPLANHPGLYRLQCDVIESEPTAVSRGLVSPPMEIHEITVP